MEVMPKDGDSIKMSFSDILDHLDMTFMGMLVTRKERGGRCSGMSTT
jgi:hypothetical protein